jgi:pimeloyl-ACP methyl ester carboxylesterase
MKYIYVLKREVMAKEKIRNKELNYKGECHMSKFTNKIIALLPILLFVLVLHAPPARSQAHVNLPVDMEGVLNGADYKIRVPVGWNGTLLVYAHGYYGKFPDEPDAAPGGEAGENTLLTMGYAVAGTSFRGTGWAVKEGIQNTLALTNFFRGQVGNPDRIILWGFSMGSVIAFKSIEKYPNIYDGAIAGCAVGAGAPMNWDGALAFSLAYDVALGWQLSWGSVGDVRDDLNFETDVYPILLGQVTNPVNFGRFEFIRLVCDVPFEEFYPDPLDPLKPNWLLTDMIYATEYRAELECRAKGPVAQNLDHVYSLTSGEIFYLNGLGVDANALLAEMNARTNIEARLPSRKYMERYSDYSGELKRPVITIHNKADGLVHVANERVYRDTVFSAGKDDMLVQVYVDSVGHCAFEPAQILNVLEAMEYWIATGYPPLPKEVFFLAPGFDNGFMPPLWPFF